MAEPNPTMVIADCIEKSKATTDQELIGEYIAETLGVLQTDNTEEDAFDMLGSAIVDEVADDPARTEALFEGSALRSTLGRALGTAPPCVPGSSKNRRRRAVWSRFLRFLVVLISITRPRQSARSGWGHRL